MILFKEIKLMKEKLNIFIIITLFCMISSLSIEEWREYPTCRLGRLQSPIEIKEYESTYANNFSFVYQNYKDINNFKSNQKYSDGNYADVYDITDGGGYINFERGGVIKQYELIRFELYPGIHSIDGQKGDFELHLVHKKNLDFITNKNQYRSIQDANMFLVVVLRYKKDCKDSNCISDSGLLEAISKIDTHTPMNLNTFSIFQDKRAYFYEGSSLHIPCDENVNYYIIKDLFYSDFNVSLIANINTTEFNQIKKEAGRYGRPVLKNFMNYREFLEGNNLRINFFYLTLIIFILFNF